MWRRMVLWGYNTRTSCRNGNVYETELLQPSHARCEVTYEMLSLIDVLVDGIVLEAKGFWVIGLLKVIVEAVKNIILNAQLESRLRNS